MAGATRVVPEPGGDVLHAAELESADGEITPGRQRAWSVAGSQMGGVLGKGRVADVVQRLDLPVVPDQSCKLSGVACSGVRLVTAQTVVIVVLPGLQSVRRQLIRTTWRVPGEEQVVLYGP
ncbi:hypothetical protein AB0C59_15575 [Streptomyces sp. NPDC048664]|uniref:hypothetical protein n=1 Tax=Streptomyces sp. NPDC048664 TaxID=3154505 RepID=UPI003439EE3A